MNILIKNVDIITADSKNSFIKDGHIGISNGYIEFVNNAEDSMEHFAADRVIDGKRKLVMPGMVNAHTHCAMTLVRNFADDMALHDWLFKKVFPAERNLDEESVYWGTLLGIAEMIKGGTTSFADMYLYMESVARAVCESGIRANLSISPLKFVGGKAIDETYKCVDYHKKWHRRAETRVEVYIEVHSAYLFDENSLKAAAKLAKELGTGIQIHLLETRRERDESIKKYGRNSAEICLECGIFDVPVIAAHCVHLTDSDMRILKQKKVHVAHNPTSNLKLASGVADIPRMLDMGINVALGTDGTASNNNLNMFEEMHLAALIHKGIKLDPILVNAHQAIEMATANGAKALGFGNIAGSIKKGMRADIIILDTDKPHFYPMNDPVSAVVYTAQAADVDTVIVDGRILMEKRELTTLDEEKIKFNVCNIAKRLFDNQPMPYRR